MLTNWKLSNFKSIREETDLNFGPLTIFAGANNSGKSSLIQSILLKTQTILGNPKGNSVVLNGPLVTLGTLNAIQTSGNEAANIKIKSTFRPHHKFKEDLKFSGIDTVLSATNKNGILNKFSEVSCEFKFGIDPEKSNNILSQREPSLHSVKVQSSYNDVNGVQLKNAKMYVYYDTEAGSKVTKYINHEDGVDEETQSGLNYGIELDPESSKYLYPGLTTFKPILAQMKRWYPDKIFCYTNILNETANFVTGTLRNDISEENFPQLSIFSSFWVTEELTDLLLSIITPTKYQERFENLVNGKFYNARETELHYGNLIGYIRDLPVRVKNGIYKTFRMHENLYDEVYKILSKDTEIKSYKELKVLVPLPKSIEDSVNYLEKIYSSTIKYLGPLRDSPKLSYSDLITQASDDVGVKGENIASVLRLHKSTKVPYMKSNCFVEAEILYEISESSLELAVNDWLQYLDVAKCVDEQEIESEEIELRASISEQSQFYNLKHVGVGVSQILPILVTCLLAPRDSIIILEQPELHLHPRVQSLLGDFFLSIAMSNKQVILETHSEHILNRLRYRIASTPIGEDFSKIIKTYFVEQLGKNTIFRDVEVNQYGVIKDWPRGFFDDHYKHAENLLLAGAKKRKLERDVKSEK